MAESERGPFRIGVVAGLIGAGILAFAAFLLLSAYAGDYRGSRDGRAHALSVSATGFRGIVELLEGLGKQTTLIRSEGQLDTEDLVVVTIEPGRDRKALRELIARRRTRPTLLILPKWEIVADPNRIGWVRKVGPALPSATSRLLEGLDGVRLAQARTGGRATGQRWLEGMTVRAPALSQTIEGGGLLPLLALDSGGMLIAQARDRPLYILADPDLMNNHSLRDPASARAAIEIVDRLNSTGAEAVAFDLTLAGFAAKPNALKLLFEPPFLALTLALFVAAVLAGLHGAFRFGPERLQERAVAFGKSALVENSAGLMRMARREHRSGAAYADLVRGWAARAAGAPPGLGGAELDDYLDRLSKAESNRFSELAAAADRASDRSELLGAARALFQWRKDISR